MPGGAVVLDAASREAVDLAVLDPDIACARDQDPGETAANTVEVEIAQDHDVSAPGGNHNPVGAVDEHAGQAGRAIEGDRFRNRHRAEATRIERVDLTKGSGLGDGASERLTRRRATAWIGVVADAGHPGSSCLSLRTRREKTNRRNHRHHRDETRPAHEPTPVVVVVLKLAPARSSSCAQARAGDRLPGFCYRRTAADSSASISIGRISGADVESADRNA